MARRAPFMLPGDPLAVLEALIMHVIVRLIFVAGFVVDAATPVVAETTTSPSVQAPATTPHNTADSRLDDNAVVCKRQEETGTRLGAHKVCHTRAEWASIVGQARTGVERIQTTPQIPH